MITSMPWSLPEANAPALQQWHLERSRGVASGQHARKIEDDEWEIFQQSDAQRNWHKSMTKKITDSAEWEVATRELDMHSFGA